MAKKKTIFAKYDLKGLNQGKKIKLRYRERTNGFYLYLDFWNGFSREYYSLDIVLLDKPNTFMNDENGLLAALGIRDNKEKERLINDNFTLNSISSSISFFDYFESIMRKRKNQNTWRNYSNTLRHLKLFSCDLSIKNVTNNFVQKFIDYLKQQNLTNFTIYAYIAKLKCVINEAVKDEILDYNHITISAPKGESNRMFLTLDEIIRFQSVDLPTFRETQNAFLFSCFSGLRFSDVIRLKFDNIKDGTVIFTQKKTDRNERLPLSKTALQIIEFQKQIKRSGLIFKMKSTGSVCRHLRLLCKAAEIDKHITFHCARHTFATLNMTMGNDLFTVSKLLGHKDMKTTQIYAKLVDEKLKTAVDNLPEI